MRIKKLTNRPAALPVLLQKTIRKQKVANNQNNKKEEDDDGDTDAKVEDKNVLLRHESGIYRSEFLSRSKNPGLHRLHAEHRRNAGGQHSE